MLPASNTEIVAMENFGVAHSSRSIRKGKICGSLSQYRLTDNIFFQQQFYLKLQGFVFDSPKRYRCRCGDRCGMTALDKVEFYSYKERSLTISLEKLEQSCPGDTVWEIQDDGLVEISKTDQTMTFKEFMWLKLVNGVDGSCSYGYKKMKATFLYGTTNVFSLCMPPLQLELSNINEQEPDLQQYDADQLTSIISYTLSSTQYRQSMSDNAAELRNLQVSIPLPQNVDGIMKVICYHARDFEALRARCYPEKYYIKSLGKCENYDPQGGKSKAFFVKTVDKRLIVKEILEVELKDFNKFASKYFMHIRQPDSCLAKILGVYQVTFKGMVKNVVVMENLLFGKPEKKRFDLKGSELNRLATDLSGTLLDENLLQEMRKSPMYIDYKAKESLEKALMTDTSFLAGIGVMDFSLLVGVDDEGEKKELVVGIIDYLRTYTIDKVGETCLKIIAGFATGKGIVSPTVISPRAYKTRFLKALSSYFLLVPDEIILAA